MKNLRSFQVSPVKAISIIGSLVSLLAICIAYLIGEIRGLRKFEQAHQAKPNPITVPFFIEPEKVSHSTRFRFTFDDSRVLSEFRQEEKLDEVVQEEKKDFKKALCLMQWARRQWTPGRPDPYPPIDARLILKLIRRRVTGGFCAQYNYVFVQAVQSFGLRARYVTIKNHEVTEVWIKELGKWVCFDPLFSSYYTLGNDPLSILEIYRALGAGKEVRIVGEHSKEIKNFQEHFHRFSVIAVWMKNNHISSPINFEDIDYYKIFYVDSSEKRAEVPSKSLFTQFASDLYFDPTKEMEPLSVRAANRN
jgi:hypothetical protein